MKKLLIATFALLVALSAVGQQKGKPSPEEHAKRQTEHMKTALNLTDEQIIAVEAINLDFAKQRAEVEKGNHDAHVALKEAYEAQLESVLTAEQMEKAKAMQKKHGTSTAGIRLKNSRILMKAE